ncbi:hypothetical protein EV426DRAFT_668013 [Tirmania nivea]|nr:hypothetical protein EV426DRAFT_668013 [Tirmania nivea]
MLRRSKRRAALSHNVARDQKTDVSTGNVAGNLGQTTFPLFPLRGAKAHPIQQGEDGERGAGQVPGESQMEPGSTSKEKETDVGPGPTNHTANELHTSAHNSSDTTYYIDQAHGLQTAADRKSSQHEQATTRANSRVKDAVTDPTNLIHAGLQSQINRPSPAAARYMPTDSSNPSVIAGLPSGWGRPSIYTKPNVNEEVGTGAQIAGTGAWVGGTPGSTAQEEQLRDGSPSGGVSPKDLRFPTRVKDDLPTPRLCMPFNTLQPNVGLAVTSSSSIEFLLNAIPTTSSRPAAADPRASVDGRSEYGGVEVETCQHGSSLNSRALSEPINLGAEEGQARGMDAPSPTASGQVTIPYTFSGVKGRRREGRSLRGGISRKPSLDGCRQITSAAKAELINTLLSRQKSSIVPSDYFSRPPSRLPVGQSATTTPGVSDGDTTHASSYSSRRESLHQNQLQLSHNQPALSDLLPEYVQTNIGTNSGAIIQVRARDNSSSQASAHPEGQAKGKAKKEKGKGVEYFVRTSESTSESCVSASQGSATVPSSGIRRNQTQTEALAHAHLAIVNRGNHGSIPAMYAGIWNVPQEPHIESIDGSTGVRSYQTLRASEINKILYEGQRPHTMRPSDSLDPNQFDANIPIPVEGPRSAPQPPSRRDSQRAHLPPSRERVQSRGFSIPDLITTDSSASTGNLATLTNTNAVSLAQDQSWNLDLDPDPQDFGSRVSSIPPEQRNIYHLWPNVGSEQAQGIYDEQHAHLGNFARSTVNTDIEINRQTSSVQIYHNLAQSGWDFPANTQTSTALPINQTAQDYYSMSGPSVNTSEECQPRSPLAHLSHPPEGTLWGYSRTTNYVLLDLSIWSDPSFGYWRRMSTGIIAPDDYTLILRADCVDEWSRYIILYRAEDPMQRVCAPAPTQASAVPDPRVGARAISSQLSQHINYDVVPMHSSDLSVQDSVNLNAENPEARNQTMNFRSSTSVPLPGPTGVSPSDFLNNGSEFQWNPPWGVNLPTTLSASATVPVATVHSSNSTIVGVPWNPITSTTAPLTASASDSTGVTPSINYMAIDAGPAGFPWNLAPMTDNITNPNCWHPLWAPDQ